MHIFTQAIIILQALGAVTGYSATLISTLSGNYNNFDGMNDTNYRIASDFITNSKFSAITGAVMRFGNSDSIPHTVSLSIYSNAPTNQPGSLIGTFDTPFLIPAGTGGGGFNVTTSTATDVGITLSPNTAYWLVLAMLEDKSLASHGQTVNVLATHASTVVTGAFTTPFSTRIKWSVDSGGTWTDSFNGNFIFSLDGFAVPEPSRMAMAILGLTTMLWWRKRSAFAKPLTAG